MENNLLIFLYTLLLIVFILLETKEPPTAL